MGQEHNQAPRVPSESERWLAYREGILASEDPFWVRYAPHVIDIWNQLSDRVGAWLTPPRVARIDDENSLWMSWSKTGHFVELDVSHNSAGMLEYAAFWSRDGGGEKVRMIHKASGLVSELPLGFLVEALISHLNFVVE